MNGSFPSSVLLGREVEKTAQVLIPFVLQSNSASIKISFPRTPSVRKQQQANEMV